jgi:hypothetical protein
VFSRDAAAAAAAAAAVDDEQRIYGDYYRRLPRSKKREQEQEEEQEQQEEEDMEVSSEQTSSGQARQAWRVLDQFHSLFLERDWRGVMALQPRVLRVVSALEKQVQRVVTQLRDDWGALTLKIDFGLCDVVMAGVATPEVSLGIFLGGEEVRQEAKSKVMTCVPGIYARLAVAHAALGSEEVALQMRERAREAGQQLSSLQRRLLNLSKEQRHRWEELF